MDSFEKKFRYYNGDELTERILRETSQMYDYPFWLREQDACFNHPDIAYEVALNLQSAKTDHHSYMQ